jgi:magnesium transporter
MTIGSSTTTTYLAHHTADGLIEVPFTGLDSLPNEGWFWLDFETADPRVILEIGTALGFDPLSIEDVVTDMLPKLDKYDHYRYLVCHGLSFSEERIGTTEYDMFLGERMVVTFRPSEIYAVSRMRERIGATETAAINTPAEFVALLLEAGSRRFAGVIESLDDLVEDLEVRAMLADNAVIGEAHALRRDVIVLRRVFRPQRDILARLSEDKSLAADARRAFADVYDHHFRFVESLESAQSLIGSIQETHRGAIAARTNEVMKVLTVFSAIMLPLTLVAGIWGMNIRLPFADSPNAFAIIVAGMSAVAVGLWLYFASRGFVGGIRLSRLPKAVGLTIAHLAAPVLPKAIRPGLERDTDDQVSP